MLKFRSMKPYTLVNIEDKVSKEKQVPYKQFTFATMGGKLIVSDFKGQFDLQEDKDYYVELTLENYGSISLKNVYEPSQEVSKK